MPCVDATRGLAYVRYSSHAALQVLGLAKNIKLELAQRFLMSLRTHAPDVDIVIFTDFDDGKHGALYRALGVRVVLYSVRIAAPARSKRTVTQSCCAGGRTGACEDAQLPPFFVPLGAHL